MIGKTISHYRILAKLGEGGMGVVYKAEDTKLGRTVALKFLPPELTRDAEAKRRFIQEARAASALDHPNICTVHEIDETSEGQTFIVMACYDGESLKAKIDRGPLRLEEALAISTQIAQGLAKAHGQGIIHRDIKPANVLVTKDGLVKIVDFGLAKLAGMKLTKTGKTLGTAQYMSPEQARGEEVDQRTDIWSLGIVLYEMLTGKHAFPGEYEQATIYAIMNEEPQPVTALRTGIPIDLERIVIKMLAKAPGERYQHADEILADISRLRKDLSAGSVAPTPKPPRVPISKKRATMIWIPACALVLVLAFLWLRPIILGGGRAPESKISIAVVNFENRTGDASYNNYRMVIPDLLITKLEQSKFLRVATWERLRDLLKQVGKGDIEVIDKDAGFEACLKGGINTIVTGSFTRAGDLFVTDVKVLDVRTKESIASKKAEGKGVESILKNQIDELGGGIAKAVGLSERRFEATIQPITDVTTTSIEAYSCFVMGREELEKHNLNDAVRSLEKAVELDSTFATAYLYLSSAHDQTGSGAPHKDLRNARRFSKTATEKERLFIEARYAAWVEGEPRKEALILRELVEKYPSEKGARRELGYFYFYQGMFAEAIAQFDQLLSLDPSYSEALGALAYSYLYAGDFEKARLYFDKYASAAPDDPNAFDSMGELYFLWGRFDDAIAEYEKAMKLRPDFGSQGRIAYLYAFKEEYAKGLKWIDQDISSASNKAAEYEGCFFKGWCQAARGNTDESIKDLSHALGMFDSLGSPASFVEAYSARFALSWVHCLRGEFDLSRQDITKSMERVPKTFKVRQKYAPFEVHYNIFASIIDIKQGNIETARNRLKETRTLLRTVEEVGGRWVMGLWKETAANECALLDSEMLLAEGSSDGAIRVGEMAPPMGRPRQTAAECLFFYNSPVERDVVARAYQKKGELDKAISEYERLVAVDSTRTDRRLIPPIFHYRLARLYEQKGRVKEAVEQYQKFLSIMSEADICLKELADARARVASLTAK
jgi:serine/threonine protein kinase/tetratricopeptide (TPR) repeat protein